MDKPIIFLTFANEQQPDGRYLKNVVKEEKLLKEILEPISSRKAENALCTLEVISNVNLDEIISGLNDYTDQDMILHFGGHADPNKLILEKDDGSGSPQYVKAEGLVPILSGRKNLKLVFLNGCSTKKMARQLVKNGIMAVIGTSSSIPDTLALKVSKHFYTALAAGKTMAGAWELAKNVAAALGDENGDSRGIKLEGDGAWDVEFRDDAAKEVFNNWNLPDAANNPLYNLPQPRKRILPDKDESPFLFLKPYEEKHAEIFFGRSFYIRDLWLKIIEPVSPSLILLYGETGTGKSSLLDAGLVPRLKASGRKDFENYPRFEVKYKRRDQDKSLVETLADLLNYASGQEIEHRSIKEGPATEITDDLKKLDKIESIVKELKEEFVKEDLLNIVDLHRTSQTAPLPAGRPVELYTKEGVLLKDAGLKLHRAWKSLEQDGKRLIIILDQVEELFTTPHKHRQNELADLLEVIKEIFTIRSDKIEGKIILGYRAEYNPKIEARIKEKELARSKVFLEPLNKNDVKDIFEGLQKGRVAKEYNIQIEKELPEKIADYLLKGKGAVAPILQFLLVQLWKYSYPRNPNNPDFSTAVFQKVSSGGREMEEYLDQQMKLVHKDRRSVVESGLVLDILKFHTSSRSTSVAKKIDSITERYAHKKKEEIIELVKLLKKPDIFLLKDRDDGYTSLPHDTLAPVIIRKYNESDKPGHRATRILDAKAYDLEQLPEDEVEKLRLDENDLKVIESGRKGMRALKEEEEDLLARSKEDLKNRDRRRRTLVKGGIVAGLFVMILSLFAGSMTLSMTDQVNNAVAVRAHEAALLELDKSPEPSPIQAEAAIQMAQFAYRENNPKRLDIVKNLYSLYDQFQGLKPFILTFDPIRQDTLNRFVSLSTQARISSLRFFPGQGAIAVLEDSKISYWPESRGELAPEIIDLKDNINDLKTLQVGFSADRKNIQVISREDRQPLYWLNNTLVSSLRVSIYPPVDGLSSDTDSLGTYDLFTGKFLDPILGISLNKEDFLDAYELDIDTLGVRDSLQVMIKYGNWSGRINIDALFSIQLIKERENHFDLESYQGLLEQITPLPLLPVDTNGTSIRSTNLTRAIHNRILLWNYQSIGSKPDHVFSDTTVLHYISALTDSTLLTVDSAGRVEIRKPGELHSAGQVIRTLRDGDSTLVDIAISPDQQYILALTRQDVIYIWNMAGEKVDSFSHTKLKNYAFATNGSDLMTLSADSICIWSPAASTRVFHKPENAPPISFARFHQGKPEENDEYLIIGLAASSEITTDERVGLDEKLKFWKKKNKPQDAQILLWNIRQENDLQTIQTNNPILLDATAGRDLKWVVALQPQQASIIPNGLQEIIKSQSEVKQNGTQVSKVEISPGGNFIVRRSEQDRKVELFTCEGQLINVYSFQDGFRQGFDHQLFTPDDHFMIGSKSNEVLFWHPEPEKEGKVIQWASQFELPLEQKQEKGIAIFMDYIPGSTPAAKWGAIAVILSALIFLLLHFSEYALSLIQHRNYVVLSLYSVGFVLLLLFEIVLMRDSINHPEYKAANFYFIVFVTLVALALSLRQSFRPSKTRTRSRIQILLLWITVIFILSGTIFFMKYEFQNYRENYKNENTKYEYLLAKEYRQNPELFHELYEVDQDSNAAPSTDDSRLELVELKQIRKKHSEKFLIAPPDKLEELINVVVGLIFLILFWYLVGRPINRAVKLYEEEQSTSREFYGYLYLPIGCLSLAVWIVYTMIFQDYNGITVNILAVIFCLFIFRKSWRYFIFNWYFFLRLSIFVLYFILTFFSYPIPLGYSFLPIALVATLLLGGFYSKYAAPPNKVFLLYYGTILLGTGALVWGFNDIEEGFVSAIFAPIYAAFLVFIFYKMASLLHSISVDENKFDRWGNRLYILGVWLLGLLFTNAYLAIVSIDYEEALFNNEDQSSIVIEPISQNTGAPDASIIPIDTNEFREITSLGETDTLRSLPNQLQQLVNKLFDPDPTIQDNTIDRLSIQYRGAPRLVEMLIQAHAEHPELAGRTVNVLFLLEIQSDEYLKDQGQVILPFLDEVENTDNLDRIDKLRNRIRF